MAPDVKGKQRVAVEPNDWELVRKCQAGDIGAFQELVAKYYQKVFMVVLGILNHREDALEIAQEAFYRAYRKIGEFRGGSSFYTWLYRIAVNQCIDFQRHQRRAPVEVSKAIDELVYEGDKHGTDPADAVEEKEIMNRLLAALNDLTPDHKAVIVLRVAEGLSYKEISKVLGCSEGTVMSRLHYARKKLQEKLAPYL